MEKESMRKIEWEPGTYNTTKDRASAIAWAMNRRGVKTWTGKNVTGAIATYLGEHGYVVQGSRLLDVMKKLVAENYAFMHYKDGGRAVKEFGFMPDVDLSGHKLPARAETLSGKPTGLSEMNDAGKAGTFVMPPIPAAGEAPLYRLDELEKLLKSWSEKDHETFATWIDAAVESLQANT